MSNLDDAINRLPHDQREAARRNPGAFFGPAAGHIFVPAGFQLTERGMRAIPGAIDVTTLAQHQNDRKRTAVSTGFVRGPLGQTLPGPGGLAAITLLREGLPMVAKGMPKLSDEEAERWYDSQHRAEPKAEEPVAPEPEPEIELRPGQGLLSGDDHGSS